MNDDVGGVDTGAILNEYWCDSLEVVFLVQKGGFEQRAPVQLRYGFRDSAVQKLSNLVDGSYTDSILGFSSQAPLLRSTSRSGGEYSGSQPV